MAEAKFLHPHGNYLELLSYRKAEIIYEHTFQIDSSLEIRPLVY